MAHLLVLPALAWRRSVLNGLDITLEALGCRIRLRCRDSAVAAVVRAAYGAMQRATGIADVTYTLVPLAASGYGLHCGDREPLIAADAGELLMLLETELSIELQKRRPDLFFLHAAALEDDGRAILLIGASGAGKSTAAWALAHEGFGYLSDELAPVAVETLEVAPYPRALCLKGGAPTRYPVPARTLWTLRALHVPPGELPGGVGDQPMPIDAVFFVDHRPGSRAPSVEPVTKGEAAARLMAHALNALAHPDAGLDAASRIASEVPAFRLWSASLPETAAVVKAALAGAAVTAGR